MRISLMCCGWWMAPLCWLDQLTDCHFLWLCRLHDGALKGRLISSPKVLWCAVVLRHRTAPITWTTCYCGDAVCLNVPTEAALDCKVIGCRWGTPSEGKCECRVEQ